MSRPYLQHGRRHAPGGSDPIVGGQNMPWGYSRYYNFTFPSNSSVITYIDFAPSSHAGGWTSGDPDITFGPNGTGRQSLIIQVPGFYMVGTTVRCTVASTPAAGSCCYLEPDIRPNNPIALAPAQPFVAIPDGTGRYGADIAAVWPLSIDGVLGGSGFGGDPVPYNGINTGITQNSGLNALIEVFEWIVKVSSIPNPINTP